MSDVDTEAAPDSQPAPRVPSGGNSVGEADRGRGPSTAALLGMSYEEGVRARSPHGVAPPEPAPAAASAEKEASEDPEAYNDAADIVEISGKLLRFGDAYGRGYEPPKPTAAHSDAYWMFWQAMYGVPTRTDDETLLDTLATPERLNLLTRANAYMQAGPIPTVLRGVADTKGLIDEIYTQPYNDAMGDLSGRASREVIRTTVRSMDEAATGKEGSERDASQTLKTAALMLSSGMKTAAVLYTRFQGGAMNEAIDNALRKAGSTASDFKVAGGAQAVTHLLGLANAAFAILNIADPQARREAAEREGGALTMLASSTSDVAAVVGGLVSLTSLTCAGIAQVAGYTDDAARLMAVGSKVVRHAGQVMAAAMIIKGTINLLRPDATMGERLNGLAEIGIGLTGLPMVMSRLGLSAGPAAFFIALTAFSLSFIETTIAAVVRANLAPFQRGFLEAFGDLIDEVEPMGQEAKQFMVALTLLDSMDTSDPGQAAMAKGLQERVMHHQSRLRAQMQRFLAAGFRKAKGTPRWNRGRAGDIPGLLLNFPNLQTLIDDNTVESTLEAIAVVTQGMKKTSEGAKDLFILYVNHWTSQDN